MKTFFKETAATSTKTFLTIVKPIETAVLLLTYFFGIGFAKICLLVFGKKSKASGWQNCSDDENFYKPY
jgi:hypothetical protein